MPHGPLTPLGRHFRTVLANLSRQTRDTPNAALLDNPAGPPARHALHRSPCNTVRTQQLHYSPVTHAPAATADVYTPIDPVEEPSDLVEDARREGGRRFRSVSRNILHRRKRVDHLTEALEDAGIRTVVSQTLRHRKDIDLSYMNVGSRNAFRDYKIRQRRHARDPASPPSQSRELSLQRILASLIRHRAKSLNFLEADWNDPFELSTIEHDFLQFKDVSLDDLSSWADIVSAEDSLHAAQLLAERIDKYGPESVPLFVYLHILRRPYISARALRILTFAFSNLFEHRETAGGDRQPIVLAVVRLLRHAREVWPQAMQGIVNMLLRHYQHQRDTDSDMGESILASTTFVLNKVMSLVSLSTAMEPFKNQPYQEAVIVSILQYMVQHDPPLPITRIGYRAVVRVQLGQSKTESEQRWARLKKLSWPPWKEDRTAIDALITAEEHGTSRAAVTLTRMREAGYAFRDWEKTAMLYAGWDVDRTPTVQLRALLGSSLSDRRNSSRRSEREQPWSARIATTRTIQEAWACYLSWEDAELPPDQEVWFEIMSKLHAEDKRQRSNAHQDSRPPPIHRPHLFPGDAQEISPLPPSTHLETYTRTPPPSLQDFYDTMSSRGVIFEGSSLAFLLSVTNNKDSIFSILRHSVSRYPEIASMLRSNGAYSVSSIPQSVVVALLRIFVKYRFADLQKAVLSSSDSTKPATAGTPVSMENFDPTPVSIKTFDPSLPESTELYLSPKSPLTLAIDILRTHSITSLQAWNSVLHGLPHGTGEIFVGKSYHGQPQTKPADVPKLWRKHVGYMSSFTLTQSVFNMMRARAIDPDAMTLYYLCQATEHMTTGAWAVLEECAKDVTEVTEQEHSKRREQAEVLLQDRLKHSQLLRRQFSIVVGQDKILHHEANGARAVFPESLPDLLFIPNAATLHRYVRVLGWLGDFDGLLTTLEWMRDHRHELADRQSRDRNGRDIMRLVVVALRVFLERCWVEMPYEDLPPLLGVLRAAADNEIVDAARAIVNEVEEWEGWATDEEVEEYTKHGIFEETGGRKRE